MIRKPVVAGQFYPSQASDIQRLIASFNIDKTVRKEKVLACILPHAGYIYSGKVAAKVLSQIEPSDAYIILGPNHTGYGVASSIMREGIWQTPMGDVKIDADIADHLIQNSKYLQEDDMAHIYEHSIEVELPLVQEILRTEFTFVPIVLASSDKLVYKDIAGAIALTIQQSHKAITIIASSDMTHYESQISANKKDREAIKAILKLDEQELLDKIEHLGITMCGYVPAVVTILAAKILGAKRGELIAYQTSGDVTKNYTSVVGYAGIVIR